MPSLGCAAFGPNIASSNQNKIHLVNAEHRMMALQTHWSSIAVRSSSQHKVSTKVFCGLPQEQWPWVGPIAPACSLPAQFVWGSEKNKKQKKTGPSMS